MIKFLLLTHENFGEAMLKSARLLMGNFSGVKALGLNRGDDIEAFSQKVAEEIQSLDDGDGVLAFADLFGASPYNATALAKRNLPQKYHCIAGLSFPMLLEGLTMRDFHDLDSLTKLCMDAGRNGIKELTEELAKV